MPKHTMTEMKMETPKMAKTKEIKYPHEMYLVTMKVAKNEADHNKLTKQGYTHKMVKPTTMK